MNPDEDAKKVEQLLEVPKLAEALESDQFKQFLDHVPFAVAVSEMASNGVRCSETWLTRVMGDL
jgi:hypothetical protein